MLRRQTYVVVLLLSAAAAAGWRAVPLSVPATPKEIGPADSGFLVTEKTAGVYRVSCFSDGGCSIAQAMNATPQVTSALELPNGCLVGLVETGASLRYAPLGCGTPANLPNAGQLGRRIRGTPSGITYGYANINALNFIGVFWSPNGATQPWSQVTLPPGGQAGAVDLLSTAQTGGFDMALAVPREMGGNAVATLVADGGVVGRFLAEVNAMPVDAHLFDELGKPAVLFIPSGARTLRLVTDTQDGGQLQVGPGGPLNTVELIAEAGDAGRGFGLVSASDGTMWGAVPNPQRVALDWVPRTAPGAALVMLECLSPQWCAGISGAGSNNVWLYRNDVAPTVATQSFTITEGQVAALNPNVTDGDGDPVFVRWPNTAGSLTFATDGGDGRGVTVVAAVDDGGTCIASQPMAFSVRVSDGWAAHEVDVPITVNVLRSLRPPERPSVLPARVQTKASDGPVTLSASHAAGCAATGFVWSYDGGIARSGLDAGAGSAALFYPPATYCRADGGTAIIEVRSRDGLGDSAPAIALIDVAPWGRAIDPSFDSGVVTLRAGQTGTYRPLGAAAHDCEGAPDFPGVEHVWSSSGGSSLTVSFNADVATVSSIDACRSDTLQLSYARQVQLDPSSRSATASLTVNVDAQLEAITSATTFDSGFAYEASTSKASGIFSVGVSCALVRNLTADVAITRVDGAVDAGVGGLAVPGPWELPVPDGCNGGDYQLTATLRDGAGTPLGPADRRQFTAAVRRAKVAELSASELPVQCGKGLDAELTVGLEQGSCLAAHVSWAQTAGPLLRQSTGDGPVMSLQAVSTELDELVGQTLSFDAIADAGAGNVDLRSGLQVRLIAEPFVAVRHQRTPAVGTNDGLVAMQVVLENLSECDAATLALTEMLDGLSYIEGSARLDGAVVAAEARAGELLVSTLPLPAKARRSFTYLARSPLGRASAPQAVATLRAYPVSTSLDAPVAPGACGCGSAPFGAGLVGAALLLLRRRGPSCRGSAMSR